jgi:hypothetical protein
MMTGGGITSDNDHSMHRLEHASLIEGGDA